MCGIIGTFPANSEIIEHGLQALQERGPDDTAMIATEFASVGITRLAITDLEGGAQPLQSRSGSTIVVFNGAIFNYNEIRLKFPGSFNSGNDGEVIHALYERYGIDFPKYINGMYAIIILDRKKRQMIMTCDPVGIKPLYWVYQGNQWVIASTIRSIPQKFWSQVRRFPIGEVWTTDGDKFSIKPIVKPCSSIFEELRHSVQSHMPSEVPWGIMLSGGIDSTFLTALAVKYSKEPVHTFTIGSPSSPDVEFVQKLSTELGFKSRIIDTSSLDLIEVVEKVIEATASYDWDIVINGVGTYLAAKLASEEGIKVLLSGEGADELFGGYETYQNIPLEELNHVLLRHQEDLGATECLRLDRCTMNCGIEARVPFLTAGMVSLARRISPQKKIIRYQNKVITKHCLREAGKSFLPKWIVEREKVPFFKGARLGSVLKTIANNQLKSKNRKINNEIWSQFSLRNPLEVWFFQIWEQKYSGLANSRLNLVKRGLAPRYSTGEFR